MRLILLLFLSGSLRVSSMTPLQRLFGDPCPGYTKDLRIKYEVAGTTGKHLLIYRLSSRPLMWRSVSRSWCIRCGAGTVATTRSRAGFPHNCPTYFCRYDQTSSAHVFVSAQSIFPPINSINSIFASSVCYLWNNSDQQTGEPTY